MDLNNQVFNKRKIPPKEGFNLIFNYLIDQLLN